jgi:thioredoxin-like negative regulator of GroEL
MGRWSGFRVAAFVMVVLSQGCQSRADAPASGVGIAWFHDLHEAHKVAEATGRPLLVVFGADWCHYCKEMERTTLADPTMVAYVGAHFVPVHLDKDRDKRVADILKVKPIPCTVVLSPNADLLGTVVGYQDVKKYRGELEKTRQRYARLQKKKLTAR